MEVVIGIMLLMGALALGQTTADREGVQTRAGLEGGHVVESLKDGFVPRDCRYRVNGPVQRDLTVPYAPQGSNDGAGSVETSIVVGNE